MEKRNSEVKTLLKKPDESASPKEWKAWKKQRKAEKRKHQEERLIREMEKKQKQSQKKMKITQDEEETKAVPNGDLSSCKGRPYTLTIALPGSILDNAQSPELRTYLAGQGSGVCGVHFHSECPQIARAAVVFNVDEIVIFDETGSEDKSVEGDFTGIGKKGQCNIQMARILQFLECPQYLRKSFFPMHKDLKYAGLLNPMDCPHHMRSDEDAPYREGVVLDQPTKPGKGSYCHVGLESRLQLDKHLQPGIRVTVKMATGDVNSKKLKGVVVAPSTPRTADGLYWGYSVRLAPNLSSVFTGSPYEGGYDVTIGTSERGDPVDNMTLDAFSHALVVFGGVKGLESALAADDDLTVDDPSSLFDHYLNTCPSQGSRTIRTEEAILITLSALRPRITNAGGS